MIAIDIATESDVDAIVQLNHALFQEDAGTRDRTVNVDWAVANGRSYFTNFLAKNGRRIWLAKQDEQPVGYLAGYVSPPNDLRLVKMAELESMYIVPDCRGQGVGSTLAKTFMEWARANGAESIKVTAYAANQRAIQFYEQLGFTPYNITLRASTVG